MRPGVMRLSGDVRFSDSRAATIALPKRHIETAGSPGNHPGFLLFSYERRIS
jgi:hypothetical protein